jgi:UDP-N-acetylbacillosamine N-acetyltransferase
MTFERKIPQGLLVIGFGGHGRSVADVALAAGVGNLLFVDDMARPGESFLDHPVVVALPERLAEGWTVFPASGSGEKRAQAIRMADTRGWPVGTVIAPTASIGAGARIARGVFVGHQAHVGPMAVIGEGALINTAAIVEHDAVVGAFTHVSVNATMAGGSAVGAFSFIGAGATVIDRVTLGDRIILGSGAVAVRNLAEAGTYIGVPARAGRN